VLYTSSFSMSRLLRLHSFLQPDRSLLLSSSHLRHPAIISNTGPASLTLRILFCGAARRCTCQPCRAQASPASSLSRPGPAKYIEHPWIANSSAQTPFQTEISQFRFPHYRSPEPATFCPEIIFKYQIAKIHTAPTQPARSHVKNCCTGTSGARSGTLLWPCLC
jgi:hypothetical protein